MQDSRADVYYAQDTEVQSQHSPRSAYNEQTSVCRWHSERLSRCRTRPPGCCDLRWQPGTPEIRRKKGKVHQVLFLAPRSLFGSFSTRFKWILPCHSVGYPANACRNCSLQHTSGSGTRNDLLYHQNLGPRTNEIKCEMAVI